MNYESIPPEANDALRMIGSSAFSTFTTIQHSYLCARQVLLDNTEGCLVECGIANGAQIGAMMLALAFAHRRRIVHLYDSFQGIPYAGPNDGDQPGYGHIIADQSKPLRERLVSTGVSGASVPQVHANLERWGFGDHNEYCLFHEGWFQDVLPEHAPKERIALLRLDGDLYESTEHCLTHLADRVVPGGIIIIDDYALPGCRKAVDEYLDKRGLKPKIESVPEASVKWWFVA